MTLDWQRHRRETLQTHGLSHTPVPGTILAEPFSHMGMQGYKAAMQQGSCGALETVLMGNKAGGEYGDALVMAQLPLTQTECENPKICVNLSERIQVLLTDKTNSYGDSIKIDMQFKGILKWKDKKCGVNLENLMFLKVDVDVETSGDKGTWSSGRAAQLWGAHLAPCAERRMIISQMDRYITQEELGTYHKMLTVIDYQIPTAEKQEESNTPGIQHQHVLETLMQIPPAVWGAAQSPDEIVASRAAREARIQRLIAEGQPVDDRSYHPWDGSSTETEDSDDGGGKVGPVAQGFGEPERRVKLVDSRGIKRSADALKESVGTAGRTRTSAKSGSTPTRACALAKKSNACATTSGEDRKRSLMNFLVATLEEASTTESELSEDD